MVLFYGFVCVAIALVLFIFTPTQEPAEAALSLPRIACRARLRSRAVWLRRSVSERLNQVRPFWHHPGGRNRARSRWGGTESEQYRL